MRVAVTGAGGFIGRHVLAELRGRDLDVVAVTRDARRLEGLCPDVRVLELDIALPGQDPCIRMGRPDLLIHLAWDGLPNYQSLHHCESELPRQYAFLKSIIESGLTSLLVAGTCFEYGRQHGPLLEQMPAQPDNPYGFAKDALRRQLEFLKSRTPFALTWTRLFYMYGENQPESSLYAQLCSAVRRGDRTFSMSGGEQLRDYLPVGEVARIIVELALQRADRGIVNVCSGEPISVRRLAETWLQEKGWEIELDLGRYPYHPYEPMAFWGDTQKLRRALDNNSREMR